jgi:hypothetical protein
MAPGKVTRFEKLDLVFLMSIRADYTGMLLKINDIPTPPLNTTHASTI